MRLNKFYLIIFFIFSQINIAFADINSAKNFTNKFSSEIFAIASKKQDVEKTRSELIEYIKQNIDINWIAKFVMGKHWKLASDQERKKFTYLLEEYLIYNYAPKFVGYKGETYEVIETKDLAKGRYISKVNLKLSDGAILALEIFILEKKGSFKIVDISGEGISFASTQRTEFGSMLSTQGVEKFLVTLENKVEELKNSNLAKN